MFKWYFVVESISTESNMVTIVSLCQNKPPVCLVEERPQTSSAAVEVRSE
jgi:hypothetical protein